MLMTIRGEVQNFVGIHPDLTDDPKKGTLGISNIYSQILKAKVLLYTRL